MKEFLFYALLWFTLVLVLLALGGFVLGVVAGKGGNRFAFLVGLLIAVGGLALTQRSNFPLSYTAFDVVAWFGVTWLLSFVAFRAGLHAGTHKVGHEQHFAESSILSMQYLENPDHQAYMDGQDPEFQETQVLPADPPDRSVTGGHPASSSAKVHIPVTRH